MNTGNPVLKAALEYIQSGLSVVPIKADGSKQPPPGISWKWLQAKRPSPYRASQMFRGDVGLAVIGGKVSGNLEIIDFDRASLIEPWTLLVEDKAPGLIARLTRVKTPKGGAHFYYRCEVIEGNEKLAQESPLDENGQPRSNTLIETRGEGGYVLAPGSPGGCHPTGRSYEHVSGPPLAEISTITPEERQTLLEAARSFNQWTPKSILEGHGHEGGRTRLPGDPLRPGDDFNARSSWQEILVPHGWKQLNQGGNSIHWRRPGKQDGGASATTGHCGENFYVFSSNAAPFESETAYTKFAAFALLNCGGDFARAAQELSDRGYGDSVNPEKIRAAEKEVVEFSEAFADETKVPKKREEQKRQEEAASQEEEVAVEVEAEEAEAPPRDPDAEAQGETAPKKGEKKKEKYKKRDERHFGNAAKYFEGKEFLPTILANDIRKRFDLIATPIDSEHKGAILYVYENGVYQSSVAERVETAIRESLGTDAKTDRIKQTLDMIHRIQKVKYDLVNEKASQLINVQNGMLDWASGRLLPHDPKYLSTIQLPIKYDPNVTCDTLDRFFSEIFPPDCVPLAEEFAGYLTIPDTSLQKAFIAVGSGGNGKGVFLKILTHMLGQDNVSALDIHSLEDDKFAVASLMGKLANIHHDLSRKQLESTSRFKTLVSGDPISGEKKHQDRFTFKPYARLVFSANEFPRSEDKTNAFFRRLIFVEFHNTFADTSREILKYDEILIKTPGFMPALLNRAIAGLRRLMSNGKFTTSETSRKAIEQYKRECNSAYDFIQEFCRIEEWGWIPRQDMYKKYSAWCVDNGFKPMSSKSFVNAIRDTAGIKEVKREGVRGWLGISWAQGGPPKTSDDEIEQFKTSQEASGNDF